MANTAVMLRVTCQCGNRFFSAENCSQMQCVECLCEQTQAPLGLLYRIIEVPTYVEVPFNSPQTAFKRVRWLRDNHPKQVFLVERYVYCVTEFKGVACREISEDELWQKVVEHMKLSKSPL